MQNYKEDKEVEGLFRLQGFINTKTANWTACIERECPFLKDCEKSFLATDEVECIYPEEQVTYEYDEQTINEIDFTAALHNATGNTFVSDILKHFRGTSTPSLHLEYGAVSTLYNDGGEPSESTEITADTREKARVATVCSGTDPVCIVRVPFTTSDGNTLSTTITGTPASRTVFDIVSATGLAIGDCVSITQTAPLGPVKRKVTGLAGTTVTLGEPLDAIPVSGNAFNQEWTRIYVLIQATAAVGDPGVVASVTPYSHQKSSAASKAITFTLRVKGT